jgi:hypothetical protein
VAWKPLLCRALQKYDFELNWHTVAKTVMLLCADADAGKLLQRYIPSVMFSHGLPGDMT